MAINPHSVSAIFIVLYLAISGLLVLRRGKGDQWGRDGEWDTLLANTIKIYFLAEIVGQLYQVCEYLAVLAVKPNL